MKTKYQTRLAFKKGKKSWFNLKTKITKQTLSEINSYYIQLFSIMQIYNCNLKSQQIIMKSFESMCENKSKYHLYYIDGKVIESKAFVANINMVDVNCIKCNADIKQNITKQSKKRDLLCKKCKPQNPYKRVSISNNILKENHDKIVRYLENKSLDWLRYRNKNNNK